MVNPIALPSNPDPTTASDAQAPRGPGHPSWAELTVAIGAFVAFCVLVLIKATALLEPDDSAYLASITALSHGELLLTAAQYHALGTELARHGGQGVMQWVHLSSGRWVSEKNPGYPFYAVVFQWLHALRLAPLFAGGLASTSLFIAGRRWLGRWGGTYSVLLFLASGAALSFAWRATMSTFTDASFIAVGASLVLWAMLAQEHAERRRMLVGLAGFAALELSTSMRYTNVVVLAVAALAVLAFRRASGLRLKSVFVWMASIAISGAAIMGFNLVVYGSATKTGYADGLITFAWSAVWPNLKHLPWPLLQAMPAAGLAMLALGWMTLRFLRRARPGASASTATRDLLVGLSLGAAWLALWGLYLAYTWTVGGGGGPGGGPSGLHHIAQAGTLNMPPMGGGPGTVGAGGMGGGGGIHVIRFYVPAIGLLALLGAWLLVQLPRWVTALGLGGIAVAALLSFHSLTAEGAMGAHGFPGGGRGDVGAGRPGSAPPTRDQHPEPGQLPRQPDQDRGSHGPPYGGPGGFGPPPGAPRGGEPGATTR